MAEDLLDLDMSTMFLGEFIVDHKLLGEDLIAVSKQAIALAKPIPQPAV